MLAISAILVWLLWGWGGVISCAALVGLYALVKRDINHINEGNNE